MNASSAAATVAWPAAVRCTVPAKNWPCGADRSTGSRSMVGTPRGATAALKRSVAASFAIGPAIGSVAARSRSNSAGSSWKRAGISAIARRPPSAWTSRDNVPRARAATPRPSVMNAGGVTR